MNQEDNRQIAGNYMGAVAHLLSGRPGRQTEFIQKVELVLSGNEPHASQLMQFSNIVRQTGRPVIWMHLKPESPHVPQVGLVALVGKQIQIFEQCWLWLPTSGGRARLIPDNFSGSFRFDDALRLRHAPKPPVSTFEAAHSGIAKACIRLRQIETSQRERGELFALPELAKAA